MKNAREALEPPEKCRISESPWIEITFTLDPEHYRTLWERAEREHRTIPGFVREIMINLLEEIKSASRKRKSSTKQNAGDLL